MKISPSSALSAKGECGGAHRSSPTDLSRLPAGSCWAPTSRTGRAAPPPLYTVGAGRPGRLARSGRAVAATVSKREDGCGGCDDIGGTFHVGLCFVE